MLNDMPSTKKSLGQHWLQDLDSLNAMLEAAEIGLNDTVLEIGPGPGTLTEELVHSAKRVIAVEFDEALARELPARVPADNLQVVSQDILTFDLTTLPPGYKVVANIPYYLTSKLLRTLCENTNHFSKAAILIQKEVAERVAARPGDMSLLSVSVQYYCETSLGSVVPARLFSPPPKVDSQILMLTFRETPLFPDIDSKLFFKVVKAGFSQRRKTLLNSLSGGLHLDRERTTALLNAAGIVPHIRAQNLSLEDWYRLSECYNKNN
ncbi:MAG TPA: 16S rRNA (adenine(1518)-N(6)/adenine(1519)-N(6))-dimethyltransferase RsmA [Candidatus Saccharimonadales bacterium]|nr:16S rRNA (adenine(1518)-N(6)/adenine(1519)-N(6))-dimethyltransferase RsmA [Candidatus Saccharimonadales bacterium]